MGFNKLTRYPLPSSRQKLLKDMGPGDYYWTYFKPVLAAIKKRRTVNKGTVTKGVATEGMVPTGAATTGMVTKGTAKAKKGKMAGAPAKEVADPHHTDHTDHTYHSTPFAGASLDGCMSFTDAVQFCQSLLLNDESEWRTWCHGDARPVHRTVT